MKPVIAGERFNEKKPLIPAAKILWQVNSAALLSVMPFVGQFTMAFV
jgi:hypothetical protein